MTEVLFKTAKNLQEQKANLQQLLNLLNEPDHVKLIISAKGERCTLEMSQEARFGLVKQLYQATIDQVAEIEKQFVNL